MNNAGDMKDYIYNNGPILVAFEVYSDFPSVWYATTVYKKTSTAVFRGGHAIYVYGWDDVKGCWLCRNSWGTWGEGGSGNFRIAYGQCGIETRNTVGMTGITHPYNNPDPNPTPTVDPNSTGDLQSIIH
jgi:C1A family cysteine protease